MNKKSFSFLTGLILFILLGTSVQGTGVDIGSLQGRSDGEIKKLAKTLSTVTSPKVLIHNESLGWSKVNLGFEQTLYHLSNDVQKIFQSKAIGHTDLNKTSYLAFMLARMGLPLGVDTELALFLPGAVDKFSVISTSFKWVPSFLSKDKFFCTPAIRQSYTHATFSQYRSNSWTTDLILSTQKIRGISLYGGGSLIKVFGEYNRGAIRATHIRKPNLWASRYLFGVDHKFELFKKADFAVALETVFMRESQSYSLKTVLQF